MGEHQMRKLSSFVAILLAFGGGLWAQSSATSPPGGTTINSYTVATLPGTATTGTLAIVTDAATAGSCVSGSGTAYSLCRFTGAAWATVGGSGGTGTLINTYTVATLPASPATNTLAIVTDSATPGSCLAGSGSLVSLCQYNSGWLTVGAKSVFQAGGTSLTSQTTVNFTTSGTPPGFTWAVTNPSAGTVQYALSATSGQTANNFLATPNGSSGALALRAIVAADLPASLSSSSSVNGTSIPASQTLVYAGGPGGIPSSLTLTNATGLPNAGLNNSTIGIGGTANQILSSTSVPALGQSTTLALANPLTLPGKLTGAASSSSAATFNLPSGSAPSAPSGGDLWNLSGVLQFYDGSTTNSFARVQSAPTSGQCAQFSGTTGLLVSTTCGGGSGGGTNSQTTSYTAQASDNGKLVSMNGASLTLTLPASPPSAVWWINVQNLNSSALSISRNGLLINGGTGTPTLNQSDMATVYTDGANYFVRGPLANGAGISLATSSVGQTFSLNTTVALTNANAEAGKPFFCQDTSGTNTSTCSLSAAATLLTYTQGMWVVWQPGTTNTSSCPTLNIDTVGPQTIYQNDGATCPVAGTIVAGMEIPLQYNGTGWVGPWVPSPSFSGAVSTGVGSGLAGGFSFTAGTAPASLAASSVYLLAPASVGTSYGLVLSGSGPSAANSFPVFGACSGSPNLCVGSFLSGSALVAATFPTPTRAGDIAYWNGSAWVTLVGNNSGTNFIQENSSGVPSWSAGSSSITWSAISNPSAAFSPSMAGYASTFSYTSALADAFQWYNTTAATSGASINGPSLDLSCGNEWHSAASTKGCLSVQFQPGNGTDAASTFAFTHTGSATGTPTTSFPGPVLATLFRAVEAAAPAGVASSDLLYPDSTAHRWKMNNNNGGAVQVVASGADINTSDQVAAAHFPTTNPGDLWYFNGSSWTNFPGNTGSAAFLQESSAGVLSWVTVGGTVSNCSTSGSLGYYSASGTTISCIGADFTYSSHTLAVGSSGLVDFSGATGSNAFKVPVVAALTVSSAGALGLDSNTNLYHIYSGAADSLVASVPTATSLTNGDCVKWITFGTNKYLGDAGVACGTAGLSFPVTVSGSTVAGGLPYFSNSSTLTALTTTAYSVFISGATNPAWATPTANGQCFMSAASSYNSTSPSFQACPSALTIQTGGANNTTQTVLNFTTPSATNLIAITPSNPSGGVEQFSAVISGATSGGIPYFSSTSAMGSSGLLATNALVQGGGAANAPTTGNGDFTVDVTAHTLKSGANGLVDFSAIASTSGFKVPSMSSGVAGAAGTLVYDTTATNLHTWLSGADAIIGGFASAPTNNHYVKATVTAGAVLLTDGGVIPITVGGSALSGTTANLNATTPAAPNSVPGAINVTPQADTGSPTTNVSNYVAGFVPRPASQRRWGGFSSTSAAPVNTGFAGAYLTSSVGGTTTYAVSSSTFPMNYMQWAIAAAANNYTSWHGQNMFRRNGNSYYAETTIYISSLTGQRFKFSTTSNSTDLAQLVTNLQPAGDYAELVYDNATDATHWICQSAQGGTTHQVISSVTLAATTIYTIQMFFSGASDANFNVLVNGVSVCGTYTTDLPTAATFTHLMIGMASIGGQAANVIIGPTYEEGGNN